MADMADKKQKWFIEKAPRKKD